MPISSDQLSTAVLCTVRYALGRMTYIVGDAVALVRSTWSDLSENDRKIIIRDIREAYYRDTLSRAQGKTMCALGMEMDRRVWMDLLREIEPARVESPEWLAAVSSMPCTEGQRTLFKELWSELVFFSGDKLPYPALDLTEDGELELCWDRPEVYFSIEVTTDLKYTWFYRDREKDTYKGASDLTSHIPKEMLDHVAQYVWK